MHKAEEIGNEAKLIMLNNKPRVVVTYLGSSTLVSLCGSDSGLTMWFKLWSHYVVQVAIRSNSTSACALIHPLNSYPRALAYAHKGHTKEVSKCTITSERNFLS